MAASGRASELAHQRTETKTPKRLGPRGSADVASWPLSKPHWPPIKSLVRLAICIVESRASNSVARKLAPSLPQLEHLQVLAGTPGDLGHRKDKVAPIKLIVHWPALALDAAGERLACAQLSPLGPLSLGAHADESRPMNPKLTYQNAPGVNRQCARHGARGTKQSSSRALVRSLGPSVALSLDHFSHELD